MFAVLTGFVALFLALGWGNDQSIKLSGPWVNETPTDRGIASLSIQIDGSKVVLDFGRGNTVTGTLYAPRVDVKPAVSPAAIVAIADGPTTRRVYVATLLGERLRIQMATEFREGRGSRSDYYVEQYFVRGPKR